MGKQNKTVGIWSISIFIFLFLISFSITSNKAKAADGGEFVFFRIDTELNVANAKDTNNKVTVEWSCSGTASGSITDATASESSNALDGIIKVASASTEMTTSTCDFGGDADTIRAKVSLDGWVTRRWSVALAASAAAEFTTGASMDYTIVVNGVDDELGNSLTLDGTSASASYSGTVASSSYSAGKMYIAGSTSGGSVYAYQNGYVRSGTTTTLTISSTASQSVDFGTDDTSSHNESGLPFAHKILVTLEGGAVVTEGVVTSGDSYGVTCTYGSAGYWYCAVPLAETGTSARHVHDNWNTGTVTYTDRTTKAASQTTATINTTRKAPSGGGSDVGTTPTPTPTPTPSISVSPTPSVSVSPTPTPSVSATPTPSASVMPSVVKLFRKVNDPKVYVQQFDGTLSWVRTLQDFVVAGYKWSDVKLISGSEFAQMKIGGKVKVAKGIRWLNVRDSASTRGKIIGKVLSNESYDFSSLSNGWYKIKKNGSDWGWVFGGYVSEI